MSPTIIASGYTRARGRTEWRVAGLRCVEFADVLRRAEPSPPARRLSDCDERAVLAEFLAASICHATNWDRLRAVITDQAKEDDFDGDSLASISYEAFRKRFGPAFADGERLRPRYELFTLTAQRLTMHDSINVAALSSAPVLLGGSEGLYARVRQIPPFATDPQAKKARVLVQELCRTGLVVPIDPERIRPAIEYHLIRLYLRTQRVVPSRLGDHERLRYDRTLVAPIVSRLREAVDEAMVLTASAASLTVAELNQIEWQIARSYCERVCPRCDGPPRPDKPCDASVLALTEEGGCPFSTTCDGPRRPDLAEIVEPRLSRRYDYY